MRLYLLPISTRQTLLYAQRPPAAAAARASLVDRATTRAAAQWRTWEAADGGWKRKVTQWGNAAVARIPYAEWGLKSIPALTRAERQRWTARTPAERERAEDDGHGRVEVVFPPTALLSRDVEPTLRRLATERQGLHRKGMWWSIAAIPLTAPLALIPIMPNLPFFYLVFRAWSHWKALAGAQHLEFLLAQQALQPYPSPILRRVYALRTLPRPRLDALQARIADMPAGQARDHAVMAALDEELAAASPRDGAAGATPVGEKSAQMPSTHTTEARLDGKQAGGEAKVEGDGADAAPEELLLDPTSGSLVSSTLGVPELQGEVERAVEQVGKALRAAEEEKESQADADRKTK